jgi:uncharacterized sulfatase
MMKQSFLGLALILSFGASLLHAAAPQRPNMLVISVDDVSWFEHSAYGLTDLPTPNVDRIFKNGIRFQNAFTSAPSCAPSRAAMLCGRQFWQNEQGAFMQAYFPKKFPTYPQILAKQGYACAQVGKTWGPGIVPKEGHSSSCAGDNYNKYRLANHNERPYLYPFDYVPAFKEFLDKRDPRKPFCFWAGIFEPHSGWLAPPKALKLAKKEFGVDLTKIRYGYYEGNKVIPRKPPHGYYYEMLYLDREIGKMLDLLEDKGLLENTIVIYIGDNGTPVSGINASGNKISSGKNGIMRAKASAYDGGVHVPMALMWKNKTKGGRVVSDFVCNADIAPTLLEAAGVKVPGTVTGRSFLDILTSFKSGQIDPKRDFIMTGMEFHYNNTQSEATRTIRDARYEYIYRFEDGSEEFYDLKEDYRETTNLINDGTYSKHIERFRSKMKAYGKKAGDPRFTGEMKIFEETLQYVHKRRELDFKDRNEAKGRTWDQVLRKKEIR